jgi:hypothetical protein
MPLLGAKACEAKSIRQVFYIINNFKFKKNEITKDEPC